MPIHRTIKNVVHNYTYAEVKVREATSNDPWGPSSGLMAEIAELTNNPLAYGETMAMIWRRLNDHGKNWRHVYKSLVLLEYLIHHGSERVTRDCRTNIIAIRTLADFQHVDENGRDNGLSVREKARQLAVLLGDDERIRGERLRAQEATERFGADSYGATIRDDNNFEPMRSERSSSTAAPRTQYYRSQSPVATTYHHPPSRPPVSNPDAVGPISTDEEELQLQLALAMSKEQHDEEMKQRKADDLKLQMAIEESKKTAGVARSTSRSEPRVKKMDPTSFETTKPPPYSPPAKAPLEAMISDPWASPARPSVAMTTSSSAANNRGPWGNVIDFDGGPSTSDPWSAPRSSSPVLYAEIRHEASSSLAPWEEVEAKLARDEAFNVYANSSMNSRPATRTSLSAKSQPLPAPDEEFAALSVRSKSNGQSSSPVYGDNNGGNAASGGLDLLDMSNDDDDLLSLPKRNETPVKKVTPEEFLGPNAKLVDFDDLVSKPTPASLLNPFALTIGKQPAAGNPFVARAKEEEQKTRVPINQLQSSGGFSGAGQQPPYAQSTVYPQLAVVYTPQTVPPQQGYNPFL